MITWWTLAGPTADSSFSPFSCSYGVFLRLPTSKFRKSALVPMRHLADTFVDDPRELFSVHQTVVGKVVERSEEAQKVTMSAKLKDVRGDGGVGGTAASVQLTRSLFRDFAKVREAATGRGALSTFAPGQPTTCTVTKATDLGIFVDVQVRARACVAYTTP